jgi:KDO2-lipid IV(A) lauroyltransferase
MSFYSTLLRILPLTFLRSIAKVAAYFINQNPDKSMLWKTRINIGLAYPDSFRAKRTACSRKCDQAMFELY